MLTGVNNDVGFYAILSMQHLKVCVMSGMLMIIVDYDAHIIPQYVVVNDQVKLNNNGTLFLVIKQMFFKGVV